MLDTALSFNDLVFLAKGAGMTLMVTAIAVFFGTVLGSSSACFAIRWARGGRHR